MGRLLVLLTVLAVSCAPAAADVNVYITKPVGLGHKGIVWVPTEACGAIAIPPRPC